MEVIAATAIFSLLLLLTIPAVEGVTYNLKLKAEAEKLAGVMRSARQEAVTSGQPRTVIFYPDGRYRIYNQVNNKYNDYRLNNGVEFLGLTTFQSTFLNYPACTFSPLGNPAGGGTVTLKITSGDRIYIITNPIEGRIRISSQPPSSWN